LGRRNPDHDWGTNPCSEIILRSAQTCNLSEVVIRPEDTLESLKRKIGVATLIGTIQSTLTDIKYLRSIWKKNMEEERLLGVSLTGIMDHYLLSKATGDASTWLTEMKNHAIEVNKKYALMLNINPSAAITCVKPSGTVSQLVSCSSGIHPAYSEYYIRTVRADMKDPLAQFMKDMGFPCEPDVTKPETTTVFYFPQKSPEGAKTRDDVSAIEHLSLWKMYNDKWSEHQVSVTINLREDDWLEAGAWVFKNFHTITGISFLPHDGGTYRQAPYQQCTREEYEEALSKMPQLIDWSRLSEYEKEDTTTATRELACVAGVCEI